MYKTYTCRQQQIYNLSNVTQAVQKNIEQFYLCVNAAVSTTT